MLGMTCSLLCRFLGTCMSWQDGSQGSNHAMPAAEAAPGTFVFLGIGDEKSGTANKLHTPRMQMLESQLPVGASLHASVALEWLQQQQLITSASLQRTEL